MTISDKYALSGNGNLVEKNKRETELHTAFFQNHNFFWSLPRNIGHRPSKCQELNKFYLFTYRCYWFLLFMLFSNISWPDLTKRTRSLTGSQHDSRKISELFHIIIRWVSVCTKWQFCTEYNFGGKLQTAIWYTPWLTLWWYGKVPISSDCHENWCSAWGLFWSGNG